MMLLLKNILVRLYRAKVGAAVIWLLLKTKSHACSRSEGKWMRERE